MKKRSLVIYLTGKPGVGKYTIATTLAENHGFIVCDNQLINNPVFELLQHDGSANVPEFAWDAIAKIRSEIFEFLTKVPETSYVLTNNLYEDEGDRRLFEEVRAMAEKRNSLFVPVRLIISESEHLRRITNKNRRKRWKTIDPQWVYNKTPLLNYTHPHTLDLDVSNLSAEDAADRIWHFIETIK